MKDLVREFLTVVLAILDFCIFLWDVSLIAVHF